MGVRSSITRLSAAMGLSLALAAVAPAGASALATGSLAASPVPAEASTGSVIRFYDAAVTIPPGDDGALAGAVRFHAEVGGATSVDVFLSSSTPVTCPDETEGFSSVTVRTPTDAATEPGPVLLDIDRRLVEAHGLAVVDLVVSTDPGCGAPSTEVTEPARTVAIDVTGTSVRFFSGIGGSVSAGPDQQRDLSSRLSRDGSGMASVGAHLEAVSSDAAFLVYGVDRSRTHGAATTIPGSPAPPGGEGAEGFTDATFDPPGGLGLVYEDTWVTAFTSAPPGRTTTVLASSYSATTVACPGGGTATVETSVEGYGPGTLAIDTRLAAAVASAGITADRWVSDGCEPAAERVHDTVTVSAALDLAATGPVVRVRDVRWHVVPGEGPRILQRGWYQAREAGGVVAVGEAGGPTAWASIARSGR